MIIQRPDWQYRAACRGMDPAIFQPERGEIKKIRLALKVCADCPVQAECLTYGLNERYGIWGGLSGKQRRRLNAKAS
jgi:WhiB family transcriptional regulator, redox-sensing transcriptional regulator